MSETEIRIGNYFYPIFRGGEVHLPATGIAYKVLTIGFDVEATPFDKIPAQVSEWAKFNIRDLSGIPLNEDWLIKMGFRMHEGNSFQSYWIIGTFENGFEITERPISGMSFCFTPRRTNHRTDLEIKYVHQLQNLYFALTNEELLK